MNMRIAEEIVRKHKGEVSTLINWHWAHFASDVQGKECFAAMLKAFPDLDHRGYYEAQPDSSNPNLHLGGFRFR
jgi:hypothetical protein